MNFNMIFGRSYSSRKISNWLDSNNLTNYKDVSGMGDSLYSTGLRLTLTDTYSISIQTNPMIAGPAFCETALLDTTSAGLRYNKELGYGDVIRHDEPEDLYLHITTLLEQVKSLDITNDEKK